MIASPFIISSGPHLSSTRPNLFNGLDSEAFVVTTALNQHQASRLDTSGIWFSSLLVGPIAVPKQYGKPHNVQTTASNLQRYRDTKKPGCKLRKYGPSEEQYHFIKHEARCWQKIAARCPSTQGPAGIYIYIYNVYIIAIILTQNLAWDSIRQLASWLKSLGATMLDQLDVWCVMRKHTGTQMDRSCFHELASRGAVRRRKFLATASYGAVKRHMLS